MFFGGVIGLSKQHKVENSWLTGAKAYFLPVERSKGKSDIFSVTFSLAKCSCKKYD